MKRKRSKMMDLLFSLVRIALGVYVGLLLFVYLWQGRYLYYPESEIDETPAAINLAYRDVSLATADGETITGWWVPAADETNAPTLLFFHGNAGNISGRLWSIQTFHDLGLNVLILDYHGYGHSSGKPSEKGTRLDAAAGWRYLTETLAIAPERIILFGRSLGGGVAVALAAEVTPGFLVIESSFTSVPDMGARMFPLLPVRWLCRYRYDSLSAIGAVDCPVLIAHGEGDTTVPFEHGRRLYAAAKEPKQFVTLGGGHNDGGMDGDRAYRAVFKEWLERYISPLSQHCQ